MMLRHLLHRDHPTPRFNNFTNDIQPSRTSEQHSTKDRERRNVYVGWAAPIGRDLRPQ